MQKVMTMTSTYDHRVIQGAESGPSCAGSTSFSGGGRLLRRRVRRPGSGRHAPTGEPAAVTADEPCPPRPRRPPAPVADAALLQAVQAATSLVKAHRMHGHLAAHLDPLGSAPLGDPALGRDREAHRRADAAHTGVGPACGRARRYLRRRAARLRETYTGTISYEIEHISDHEQRVWLRQAIESGAYRAPLDEEAKRRLLGRLSQVEALEATHKAFLGKKQFSIEGLDALVPMLDEAIELGSADGAREVVVGMAHRGRLNVLAHTVGRPYEAILAEFEGQTLAVDTAAPEGGTGDVKYRYGPAAPADPLGPWRDGHPLRTRAISST